MIGLLWRKTTFCFRGIPVRPNRRAHLEDSCTPSGLSPKSVAGSGFEPSWMRIPTGANLRSCEAVVRLRLG